VDYEPLDTQFKLYSPCIACTAVITQSAIV